VIKVNCHKCRAELDAPGVLVLSSPDSMDRVTKHHVCWSCAKPLYKWLHTLPRTALSESVVDGLTEDT
jgi:hypothetical protein